MKEITDFLTGVETFFLATMDGDQPRVRPFSFFMRYEGKLYLATSVEKPTYAQLQKNPKFELTALNEKMEWLRLSGKAVFDPHPDVKVHAFMVAPYLEEMYGNPDSPALAFFYTEDGEATFCSMNAEPRTVEV